jgi:DNA polymerase III subunit epsilon
LLAEVYLAMTRGQDSLLMELEAAEPLDAATMLALRELKLVVMAATAEELEAHEQQLEMIERESKGKCIWKKLESEEKLESEAMPEVTILETTTLTVEIATGMA